MPVTLTLTGQSNHEIKTVDINSNGISFEEGWMHIDDYGIVFWHLTRIHEELCSVRQINFSRGIADGYQSIDDLNDGCPVWSVECDLVLAGDEAIFTLYPERGTEKW